MGLGSLPRTISLVRAGESYEELNEKAAAETAAFVCEARAAQGAPVAVVLDQTALPSAERYICTCDWRRMVETIQKLEVRGAPAIGIAGAIAVVLGAVDLAGTMAAMDAAPGGRGGMAERGDTAERTSFLSALEGICAVIAAARPTAVNLAWAVDKMLCAAVACSEEENTPESIVDALYTQALLMISEDEVANRRIGAYGAALLPPQATVLTHCNAGSLATAFYGTALGVIYAAADARGIERVFADETRPVGQGARLTVWELSRAGIPVTLICDNMAASVMSEGAIDAVIVGADRVAANGDTANKIGTLGVAIIAKRFGVPFYVACPVSTIDADTATGAGITIEQRSADEVLTRPIEGVDVFNPAFDVTPAELITAIITDAGVFAPEDITEALGC